MKKLQIIAVLLLMCCQMAAQEIITLENEIGQRDEIHYYMDDPPLGFTTLCITDNQQVILHARTGCDSFIWNIDGVDSWDDPIEINPQVHRYSIQYVDLCNPDGYFVYSFYIEYVDNKVPNSYEEFVWAQEGEPFNLQAVGEDSLTVSYGYSINWEGGPNTNEYSPSTPGDYVAYVNHVCGTATRIFKARHNVEIYRATVDLETNQNKVTWQTNETQAEFISQVKVYRDGLLVGTVPYEQGYFLANIGSDNAARNYHLVSVTTEGAESSISSYQKGTIHTTYYEDVNSNLNMTWNIPYVEEGANGTLTYFQICKYDPATGDLTVVDQVNAAITDYTCGVNQFDGGYAVIAAVFNDGMGVEELSFSNLTTEILGIEEDGPSTGSGTFIVYPNPAKDRVTIEGTGKAIITNALGQTILTKEIDGKATIELPRGMYFVKMNGVTRKIVVE